MKKPKEIRERPLPLKVRVKLLARDCSYCARRGPAICPLCATLVTDGDGAVYLSRRPLGDGNGWHLLNMADLAPVPRGLAT